jgi:hypothetical protein
MRTLTVAAQAAVATKQGKQPVMVIEVQWTDGQPTYYADDVIDGVATGTILEVSGLDEAVIVSGGGNSQQLTVTIDDTDGTLKAIYDSLDVHKRPVRVWQWFKGLAFSDRFLVFKGQINSPVQWLEGERQFKFSIVNRIEDAEVGFSAEEGEFSFLPEDLIGKAWPLVFGTCINVPALKAVPIASGTLASGVGIRDFTLATRLALAKKIVCPQNFEGYRTEYTLSRSLVFIPVYKDDAGCIQQRCIEIERLTLELAEQKSYEYPTITVYGGNKFPQDQRITIDINGAKFQGVMHGETFTITSRLHPMNDGQNGVLPDNDFQAQIETKCEGVPDPNEPALDDGIAGTSQQLLARSSRQSWEKYRAAKQANFFWASGGSTVRLAGDGNEIIYIANILPSTVLRVAAYRQVNGNRYLLTVPPDYYTVRQTDYTGYDVVEIVFTDPLSIKDLATGGGWTDDIYVTLTSSVGPNTVDIIRWFIETYTGYAIDATSFNHVETLVDNYPMHFPLLDRRNLITVLQQIAEQARCALWQKDDTFYIKYLPEQPTPVATITTADILPDSMEINLTSTEDVVTKFTARWRKDHAAQDPNTLILRHNVKVYGTQAKEYDYYTFNILDLVRKASTFWLIRRANSWRRVKFSTPLHLLKVETFDAVTLDLPQLADVPILCVVEKATYNSDTKRLDFECWTPLLSGSRTPYPFAYPADVDEMTLFPTIDERNVGKAGSGTEPNFSTIAPPNHPLRNPPEFLVSGASLACNGAPVAKLTGSGQPAECRDDHGDKWPSDRGDTKPNPNANSDTTGNINTGTSPVTNGSGSGYWSNNGKIKEQTNQGNNNADRAREDAARSNDSAGNNSNSDPKSPGDPRRKAKNLPDPTNGGEKTKEQVAEEDCQASFEFTLIVPSLLSQQAPKPPTGSGPGRPAISAFIGPQILFFPSTAAAEAARQARAAEWAANWEAWSFVQGGQYVLGGDVTPVGGDCEVVENPNQGPSGYHNGSGQDDVELEI